MLAKVMKYDFKSIGKSLLPLYFSTILSAAMTRILILLGAAMRIFEVLGFFANVLTLFLVVALLFMTFVLSIKRFYCHLFKQEGYLTNMLPVKIGRHIISKFFIATVYCILTIATVMLTLFISYYDMQLIGAVEVIVAPIITLLPIAGTAIILTYLSYVLLFMASYSLGQMALKSKIMFSITGGAAIYFLIQIIALLGLGLLHLINPNILTLLDSGDISSISMLLRVIIVLQIISICIYFLITTFALNRKMDLE